MDNFSLKNVYNILLKIIFGSAIVFPLSLSNYNLSHQEGLSLKYSKTAPPLAIFDDEKISPLNEDLELLHHNKSFVGNEIITILPGRYRAVEEKAKEIISSTEYKEYLNKFHFEFF